MPRFGQQLQVKRITAFFGDGIDQGLPVRPGRLDKTFQPRRVEAQADITRAEIGDVVEQAEVPALRGAAVA